MIRVLLVEDSPTQAAQLAFILEDEGFTIDVCHDADTAWRKLRTGPAPDLVVSDLLLPGDTGFTLCRRIKAEPELARLPVVVLTSQDEPANVLRGLEAGADAFMTKDREPAELVERIRRTLARASAGGEDDDQITFLGQRFAIRAGRGQLLEVLVGAFEDLVRLNRRNERTISELLRAEGRIRSLNAELEERVAQLATSNRELEAFSYSLSHDLRAPLRSMTNFSDFLLRDYAGALDEKARDYLDRIINAADRMGRLIDAMIGLAHATRVELRRQPIDLAVDARLVSRELQRSDPGREVQFVIPAEVRAEGDPDLLRVVLENLLGNAWKYTARHATARIELGVERDGSGPPVYFVRDDGAGFDMTHAEKLFTAFHRLHGRREFEGSGIGLATVRRIIERHGGRIWARGGVEQGATFYFTLG